MDGIFDDDLATTAKILKLDRFLILRFKYEYLPINNHLKSIPSAIVEVVYNWQLNLDDTHKKQIISYQLSDSPLTCYGWQKSPSLIKIKDKKQLNNLNINNDIFDIFDLTLLQSLLIIPLFVKRNSRNYKPLILGLLVMQNYQSRTWEISEIEVGKWMAKQVTSSILNQQTVAKVQSLVDERTTQLQVSLDVQAKLGQRMRDHIEELKRLNMIKDEFIASLSDALKTPLSNMKMGIKMLKLINKNQQSIRYLDILEDECEKEINLVNNLLTLQELESNKLTIEHQKIYLKPLLDDLYNFFSQELHYKQIKFIIDNQLNYIYTDLNSITLIIKELLHNASKFSLPQTDIKLRIYQEKSDNIIEISNYGCLINTDEQIQIFQPFYQGIQIQNITNSGTGLGLALVKSLVQNLNGIINVSSISLIKSNNYLNTFTIIFPQLSNE
ncbi:MAG: HAMP domain-containing histidine kinase [Cyanobacteria bacterium]|nr:HAMP domain-containing histidine kinase [Cyanobacteria bacterium CG_2015-16_32_12]NCO77172.1 HAMP domain-containing histidine kinase [Cyanobacteria bacterium CG_2015-22_32_23]NCQ04371.1 HAMP domain-containing histidine kinase [Cyanobacteria bacterium CG_2015-09_32_10]NCQ40777.1 HAMP domain-containing histidine kinase [Cyanobacteria bacterium CG_2015-04_32_10]NCS83361.1 HAMP domain-containing histidine kinase [Cyanobacteria bacterium CG_2015-02_32_10]